MGAAFALRGVEHEYYMHPFCSFEHVLHFLLLYFNLLLSSLQEIETTILVDCRFGHDRRHRNAAGVQSSSRRTATAL